MTPVDGDEALERLAARAEAALSRPAAYLIGREGAYAVRIGPDPKA